MGIAGGEGRGRKGVCTPAGLCLSKRGQRLGLFYERKRRERRKGEVEVKPIVQEKMEVLVFQILRRGLVLEGIFLNELLKLKAVLQQMKPGVVE